MYTSVDIGGATKSETVVVLSLSYMALIVKKMVYFFQISDISDVT